MKRSRQLHVITSLVAALAAAVAPHMLPWSGELLLFIGMLLLVAAWAVSQLLQELRQQDLSLGQLEAAAAQLPWAILLLDAGDAIRFANPGSAQLSGYSVAQLRGQPIWQLLPTWNQLRAVAAPPTHAEDAAAPRHRVLLRGAKGVTIPVDVRLVRLPQHQGGRTLVLLRDQRSEQRASDDLWRMQQIVHEAGWGIVVGTPGDKPVFDMVNPAFARMVGYTPEELLGQPITTTLAPSHHGQVMRLREAAARDGNARGEMRHRHRDGREFATLADLSVVRDGRGQVLCFVVSVQDISELKRVELQLRQSVSRLGSVLDALPVGVWIANEHGELVQTNPAAQRLWQGGETSASAADQATPWWLAGALPAASHGSLLRRAMVTGAALDSGVLDTVAGDGSRRAILTTASPMRDEAGHTIGAVAVDEDLTAIRQGAEVTRRAHAALERIIDTSAVGMAVCDGEGLIARTNVAWRAQLGPSQGPPAQAKLAALFLPADALLLADLLQRVCGGALPSHMGEYRLLRANGQYTWNLLVISRLPLLEGPAQALVQVMDTENRRLAVEALSASQSRLAAAQRLAGMGDWMWLVDGDRLECSDQMLSLLGNNHIDSVLGLQTGLLARLLPEDRAPLVARMQAAASSGGRFSADCRMQRADGAMLDVHLQGVMQQSTGARRMAGTLQDVTERKRIEQDLTQSREQLRELVVHEDQIIEQERKRIAREVHDELGQLLTALRMDLSMLRGQLDPGAAALTERADRMRDTMGRMSDVVRHVAANLRPGALDMGLIAAIEWLAEDFSLRWEVSCQFDSPSDEGLSLPEPVALALFRAAQESLTNVARHAAATQVQISLGLEDGVLRLRIRDNGHGFDVAATATRRRSGLGLLGMRERMLAIGASLDISSQPSGTIIEIRCPLSPATASAAPAPGPVATPTQTP